MSLTIALLIQTIAFALYSFAPGEYSLGYCALLLGVFIISTTWFVRITLYKNYFNFHVLFIIGYFLVHFAYPVFVYPKDPFYFYIYRSEFNHSLITVSTALALLGISSYILGAILFTKAKKNIKSELDAKRYESLEKPLFILSLAIFALFVYYSRNNISRGVFNAYSTASEYILIAFKTIVSLAIVITFIANMHKYDGRWRSVFRVFGLRLIVFSTFVVIVFLFIGDRGPALQIILIYGALITTFAKPLKLKVLALAVIAGMYLMMFVSHARTTNIYLEKGENTIVEYYKRGREIFNVESMYDLGRDMIVNNRNLFVAVDFVKKNNYTLGQTFLTQIFSVVPGLQSLYVSLFQIDINKISSGQLMTYYEYEGEQRRSGLGNTIVADVYISFGVLGVILMMMIFGYYNMKFQIYAMNKKNIYYIIAYAVSVSLSVYYPRSAYFIALRSIIWPILIIWIFDMSYKKNNNKGKTLSG